MLYLFVILCNFVVMLLFISFFMLLSLSHLISPVREHLAFTNVPQRQSIIQEINTVLRMSDKPLELEFLTFYIIVPVKLWRLYFLLIKLVPVDILEPGIVLQRGKGGPSQP
jgi:hypothetical protein